MTLVENIISKFPDARKSRNGKGWKCKCPVHDDRKPSLSISEGDKGIVMICRAGCRTEDVVNAIGMKMSDLFYNDRPTPMLKSPFKNDTKAPEPKAPLPPTFDWDSDTSELDTGEVKAIADWRGFKIETIAELCNNKQIGIFDGHICFPFNWTAKSLAHITGLKKTGITRRKARRLCHSLLAATFSKRTMFIFLKAPGTGFLS